MELTFAAALLRGLPPPELTLVSGFPIAAAAELAIALVVVGLSTAAVAA